MIAAMSDRLVVAQIDLLAFTSNFMAVRKHVGKGVKVMAVVKGNAYGHGLLRIAREAEKLGAAYLGVACLYEARILRVNGIKTPILLLGYTDPESLEEVVKLDVTPTVIDSVVAKRLDKLGKIHSKQVPIHIKVDTGMHRLGLSSEEVLPFIISLKNLKHIFIEGIFTHFAQSDSLDPTFTYKQLEIFNRHLKILDDLSLTPPLIHAANSAALTRFRDTHFTMVRAGKMLYGPIPLDGIQASLNPKQIISLKTYIAQVRTLNEGDAVGYGGTFVAKKPMKIATISIGYADGFRRSPATFGEVLVKGKRCPIIGRVSMDQSTIDVSNVDGVRAGDEVIVIGQSGNHLISVCDVARRLGTNNYEVLTSLSERVGREYI